jgi:hypothetical protein
MEAIVVAAGAREIRPGLDYRQCGDGESDATGGEFVLNRTVIGSDDRTVRQGGQGGLK